MLCLAVMMAGGASLSAQERRVLERHASFTLGASVGDGGTALASTLGLELTRSRLTSAVSFGGGATFNVTRRIGIGIDLRSLHLLDARGEGARFIPRLAGSARLGWGANHLAVLG